MPSPQQIVDDLISHSIDLLRVDASLRAQVIKQLQALQRDLTSRLASEDLTALSRQRLEQLLRQAKGIIDKAYSRIADGAERALSDIAGIQFAFTQGMLKDVFVAQLEPQLPTAAVMRTLAGRTLIEGAPSATWWGKQSADLAFRFSNVVRQGVFAGDTTLKMVSTLRGKAGSVGVLDLSRRSAEALIRTSVQAVSAEATRATYRANSDIIKGVRQMSTLDARTTDICIAYHDKSWTLDGEPIGHKLPYNNGVPRHWNCRSREIPITKTFRELGIDSPEFVPDLPSFQDWLIRRTIPQQNQQLGASRAKLFREGKISLTQLLDFQGHPLSVEQLRAKFETREASRG